MNSESCTGRLSPPSPELLLLSEDEERFRFFSLRLFFFRFLLFFSFFSFFRFFFSFFSFFFRFLETAALSESLSSAPLVLAAAPAPRASGGAAASPAAASMAARWPGWPGARRAGAAARRRRRALPRQRATAVRECVRCGLPLALSLLKSGRGSSTEQVSCCLPWRCGVVTAGRTTVRVTRRDGQVVQEQGGQPFGGTG